MPFYFLGKRPAEPERSDKRSEDEDWRWPEQAHHQAGRSSGITTHLMLQGTFLKDCFSKKSFKYCEDRFG